LEIPREQIDTLLESKKGENSDSLRAKVVAARNIQQERFKGLSIKANAHMTAKELQEIIPLDSTCKDFLSQAAHSLNLSGRVVHRTIKLARTIADMYNEPSLAVKHLAEAIQYRSRTMFMEEA
jgi:magnesium chelatase family protein